MRLPLRPNTALALTLALGLAALLGQGGNGSVNFLDLGIMKSSFFLPPGPSGLPNLCDGS